MFFIRGDKVTLHTLMKNSLLMARCSANHYNEQSGICKTDLPRWNHSWSCCGVNGMFQRQFGMSVIVEQIAQYHLVFLYELLISLKKKRSWVEICFLLTWSESCVFFTSCFMGYRSHPSFTFGEERPGDAGPCERTDLPTWKHFRQRRTIAVWHLLKSNISKSAALRKILNECSTGEFCLHNAAFLLVVVKGEVNKSSACFFFLGVIKHTFRPHTLRSLFALSHRGSDEVMINMGDVWKCKSLLQHK